MKDMAEISSEDKGNHKENNDSQGATEDVTHNPVNELMEDNASKGASVFSHPLEILVSLPPALRKIGKVPRRDVHAVRGDLSKEKPEPNRHRGHGYAAGQKVERGVNSASTDSDFHKKEKKKKIFLDVRGLRQIAA